HQYEQKVGQALAQEHRFRRRRGHAVSVEHTIAQLARPGLVQSHGSGEEKRDPDQAAGNTPRLLRRRLHREAKNDHHQSGEKQHGVKHVARAPLQAQVLTHVGCSQLGNGEAHALTLGTELRSTSSPAESTRNSSAVFARRPSWCVTRRIVFPAARIAASNCAIWDADSGSTLENGSSSSSSCGEWKMARASGRRWRKPCEV